MNKELNDLVSKLTHLQDVEVIRPEKNAQALKESIDRNYVHIMFKDTGTEIGVQLYRPACALDDADFIQGNGQINLTGRLTLNYNKVKCIADIDLASCEGKACLVPVTDEEYALIMDKE